ncbi:MAG: hypothetical protein KAS23_08360, partial [Anaerohalosphaera sp.]|nr:hypothetical protein [Anaerohalosphaera sp.]
MSSVNRILSITALTVILSLSNSIVFASDLVVFNDNGAWCWYQDERVIVHNNKLIMGSVADSSGTEGATRSGNIEVVTYDIGTAGPPQRFVLHANLQDDDHDLPAFLALPDNNILAIYSKHSSDGYARWRITTNPDDVTGWIS